VLEACLKDNTRVFIASTSEVYGKARKFPQEETDDLTIGATVNIRWSYACAKMLDEFLALAYVQEHDLPVTILRFFNTTGPRQTSRYGMVIPSFVDAALKGAPLKVHGTGEQSRCFCHVADVIESLVRMLDTPGTAGQVYNIGTDAEVTIRALAERVVKLAGSSSDIETIPYEKAYGAGFEDMQRRRPDISKLEQAIGYRPTTPLDTIITDLIAERQNRS
jgi:UDP-glucose 4-epimerase